MQLLDGRLLLSASDLISYLECAHLTRLGLEVVRGEIVLEETRTDAADLVARKGDEHDEIIAPRVVVNAGRDLRSTETARVPRGGGLRSAAFWPKELQPEREVV